MNWGIAMIQKGSATLHLAMLEVLPLFPPPLCVVSYHQAEGLGMSYHLQPKQMPQSKEPLSSYLFCLLIQLGQTYIPTAL